MKKISAGLLIYRKKKGKIEVLLIHPGGPFWAKKDLNAWSIPKGEIEEGEDFLDAAKREVNEEIGVNAEGDFINLGSITQKGGKTIYAWALEGDYAVTLGRGTFSMEWPPKSQKIQEFPEADKAEYFGIDEARTKMNPAQVDFLNRLIEICQL